MLLAHRPLTHGAAHYRQGKEIDDDELEARKQRQADGACAPPPKRTPRGLRVTPA